MLERELHILVAPDFFPKKSALNMKRFNIQSLLLAEEDAICESWLCKICRLRNAAGIFHLTKNANFAILTALRS